MRTTAHPRAVLRPLVERAAGWLVEPPGEGDPSAPQALRPPLAPVPPPPDPDRPVVVVLGLAPGCGASTIARALAAALAARDPDGAALLSGGAPARSPVGAFVGARAVPAAARLARAASAAGVDGVRACGRLCLVPHDEPLAGVVAARAAPLVADVPHGAPAEGALALADHAVLVAPPEVEPSLAVAVETSLRAGGHGVSLVLNRAPEPPPADLEHALLVPEGRLAAQLTLGCRAPRGPLAPLAAELAERCLAEVRR